MYVRELGGLPRPKGGRGSRAGRFNWIREWGQLKSSSVGPESPSSSVRLTFHGQHSRFDNYAGPAFDIDDE